MKYVDLTLLGRSFRLTTTDGSDPRTPMQRPSRWLAEVLLPTPDVGLASVLRRERSHLNVRVADEAARLGVATFELISGEDLVEAYPPARPCSKAKVKLCGRYCVGCLAVLPTHGAVRARACDQVASDFGVGKCPARHAVDARRSRGSAGTPAGGARSILLDLGSIGIRVLVAADGSQLSCRLSRR
jgi:hypothetical protein